MISIVSRVVGITGRPLPWQYRLTNHLKAYLHRTAVERVIKYVIAGEARIPNLIRGHVAFDYSRPVNLGARHDVRVTWDGLPELLDFCRQQDLPVLIFEPPNNPGFSELSVGRTEALANLRALIDSDPDITFLSFNDEASLAYADNEWLGLNHLNARGAARFSSEQLAPYLAELLHR